jgi:ribosomal protein S18 acetylase RimI-like enzyme
MTNIEKDLEIREIKPTEYSFLNEMLYQAIFVADKKIVLAREIIEQPDLIKYIQDFGKTGDFCLVAEQYGKLLGAIWIRFIKGYGFVDNETPELSIAVLNGHRGNGIGKQLLTVMIDKLKDRQLKRVSLSVDRENFAYGFYKKHGFVDYLASEKSIIMTKKMIET